MASPDFSAAAALHRKAAELLHIGHFARAAAKVGAALDEARAQCCPDCLVVARLQLEHTLATSLTLCMDTITDAEYKALRTAAFEQTLAAAATLQRRRAAGTLQPGRCTAAEVAWQQQLSENLADVQHWSRVERAASLKLVQFSGYTLFVQCANDMLRVLQQSTENHTIDITAEQLRTCWTFIADAVECMVQVRVSQRVVMSAEGTLVRALQAVLAGTPCIVPHDDVGERLHDAWRRLRELGGSLQQVVGVEPLGVIATAVAAAADAAAADPGLRRCGLASCGAREQHPSHFKSCAACRGVAYCSKEHQTEDWPNHKAPCKAARKAAAAGDGAGPSGA